ncbi:MAG: indolepyruvate oxidoreductase subunit beta [Christensenellales bacterium]
MTDILIVGVGGQGTLLASRVLGNLALSLGYDVKLSEVHGMAQRGGSVVTHIRFGDTVLSPVIDKGGADIILAFEKLEALRWSGYLKKGGKMFVSTQEILPMPVITGAEEYPRDIAERIKAAAPDVVFVDALSLARKAGDIRTLNTVLIGALARRTDIEKKAFIEAVKATVPKRAIETNIAAFELGYNL